MRALFLLFALALVACSPTPAPVVGPAPAPTSELVTGRGDGIDPPNIAGHFTAMSTTAMSITGDMDVDAHFLNFSRGFRIEGDSLSHMLEGHTDLSAGGGTITDASGVQNIDAVQVRRIHVVHVAADAADPQLCGGTPPRYAILAENADTLSLLIFSGAEAPGPNTRDSELCGIFNYSTN